MFLSNDDDPAVEEKWCSERRSELAVYLKREGVTHGSIGEWPAWHIAPYVSIRAVESAKRPGYTRFLAKAWAVAQIKIATIGKVGKR